MRFEDGLKLFVRRTPGSDHLVVKWDAKSAWAPDTTIFIQAHHSSTCPGVKDRLTAKECEFNTFHFILYLVTSAKTCDSSHTSGLR